MNQTDLCLIDAHIEVELARLQTLLLVRNKIYQHLPAGRPIDRHLKTYRYQMTTMLDLLDGRLGNTLTS
jgi:hypothetical protein